MTWLLGLIGCLAANTGTSSEPTPTHSDGVPTPPLISVTWELAWDWADATPGANGSGFMITTDLGYNVSVDTGELVSWRTSLVPCIGGRPDTGWLGWLKHQIIGFAWAGDSVTHDPSSSPEPVVESLAAPAPQQLGTVLLEESIYCELHYLVAPESLGGLSLALEGSVNREENSWPLSISTSTALGETWRLDEITYPDHEPPLHVTAIGTRRLATLFDGIDFLTEPSMEETARSVLRNLMDDTHFSVSSTDAP